MEDLEPWDACNQVGLQKLTFGVTEHDEELELVPPFVSHMRQMRHLLTQNPKAMAHSLPAESC
jgi:hypothetical protein